MAEEIRLPKFGHIMEEGTVVAVLVAQNGHVSKGDVIFEIETDKATIEMESPAEGFVKKILIEQGRTVAVGEPMLVLGGRDEDIGSFIDSLKIETPAVSGAESEAIVGVCEPVETESAAGVPLSEAGAETEVKFGRTIPLNRLQKITARKMLQSKREIPCFYLTVKTDVTDLVELRQKLNSACDVKIAYNDFIMRAVAIGLEKFPIMTGQLVGDAIQLAQSIGIGLAISVPGGLVAPIIKDVNKKELAQIARDTAALIERAQNNKLTLDDIEGGCITISNLGAFGVDTFIPIVVPGQCAILGIGQISDTCTAKDDDITVRKFMNMTLSVDHKVVNGAYAAQFLDFVKKNLQNPQALQ